jgi:two-component system, response regulator PdtaR
VEEAVPPLRNKQEVKPTILIVEDHFMTRWSAAEYLRRRGYKVLEAVNLTEALGLASGGTPIDVVFSDVQLGDEQGGHELAQWFGKHRPSIPVLLTSGADNPGPSPMSELRSFVRKPYELTQVESLLRSMIERR